MKASTTKASPQGDQGRKKENLGLLLRQIRRAAGVGLKSAGPALGVDYSYLSKIENGLVSPSNKLLGRLADYYGADPDELFTTAGRLPPDAEKIVQEHPQEVTELLRKRFGGGQRKR